LELAKAAGGSAAVGMEADLPLDGGLAETPTGRLGDACAGVQVRVGLGAGGQ